MWEEITLQFTKLLVIASLIILGVILLIYANKTDPCRYRIQLLLDKALFPVMQHFLIYLHHHALLPNGILWLFCGKEVSVYATGTREKQKKNHEYASASGAEMDIQGRNLVKTWLLMVCLLAVLRGRISTLFCHIGIDKIPNKNTL